MEIQCVLRVWSSSWSGLLRHTSSSVGLKVLDGPHQCHLHHSSRDVSMRTAFGLSTRRPLEYSQVRVLLKWRGELRQVCSYSTKPRQLVMPAIVAAPQRGNSENESLSASPHAPRRKRPLNNAFPRFW
eukprot:2820407-Amphidinium_carterae.1